MRWRQQAARHTTWPASSQTNPEPAPCGIWSMSKVKVSLLRSASPTIHALNTTPEHTGQCSMPVGQLTALTDNECRAVPLVCRHVDHQRHAWSLHVHIHPQHWFAASRQTQADLLARLVMYTTDGVFLRNTPMVASSSADSGGRASAAGATARQDTCTQRWKLLWLASAQLGCLTVLFRRIEHAPEHVLAGRGTVEGLVEQLTMASAHR